MRDMEAIGWHGHVMKSSTSQKMMEMDGVKSKPTKVKVYKIGCVLLAAYSI